MIDPRLLPSDDEFNSFYFDYMSSLVKEKFDSTDRDELIEGLKEFVSTAIENAFKIKGSPKHVDKCK